MNSIMSRKTKIKELLINEVQRRPVLWQEDNCNYKNKKITERHWRSIASIFNTSTIDVKNKWKNLKDNYRRELRKQTNLNSRKKPKWQFFELLSFLKDYMIADCTEDNIPFEQSNNDDDGGLELSKQHKLSLGMDEEKMEHSSSSLSSSSSCSHSKSEKNRLQSDFLKFDNERLAYLKERRKQKIEEDKNPDLFFFKSLLPHLNSFTESEKLDLKTSIMQMISRAKKVREQRVGNCTTMLFDFDLSHIGSV